MRTNLIDKKVIARINRAGVFYGVLDYWDDGIIRLKDVRRIYRWQGALSVTDMAANGISNASKVTHPCSEVEFVSREVIEVNECSDIAGKKIEGIKTWTA